MWDFRRQVAILVLVACLMEGAVSHRYNRPAAFCVVSLHEWE
jgi:hypothetical protein